MPDIIPPSRELERVAGADRQGGDGPRFLQIGQLHYYGNDIAELRKLAEVSPELADKVLELRDKENARSNVSFRFGIVSSIALVIFVVLSFTYVLVHFGISGTLVVIGCVLAVALLIRVIITGQWSDTSWFGRLIQGLASALGSSASSENETKD